MSDSRFGNVGDGERKSGGAGGQTPPKPRPPKGRLTVMTRNLCLGADLSPILLADGDDALVRAVAEVFDQAKKSDFASRASAWADEIDVARPDLIGLQEVAIFRTRASWPPGPQNPSVVEFDFLELLMRELGAHGLRYEVVAEVVGQEVELPALGPSGLFGVSLTQREVILARTDALTLSDRHGGQYEAQRRVSIGGTIQPLPWAWAAIDAEIHGTSFRFATTHLEPDDAEVQMEQAREFLTGPARAGRLVIWVGDFNSDAEGGPTFSNKPPSTGTYMDIRNSGFSDAWTARNPGQPGFTCCQAVDLRNRASQLDTRVDLVLTSEPVSVVDAHVVGDQPPPGLWASDHAGLVVTFEF